MPFRQLKGVILLLYQSENWGLLSAKKTEYFDWKILQSLILAHCPCQRCNWEFVISILHHLTKDYTALMGFCGSEVLTEQANHHLHFCQQTKHMFLLHWIEMLYYEYPSISMHFLKVEKNLLGQKEFHFGKSV